MTRVAVTFPRGAFLREYERRFVPLIKDELVRHEASSGFRWEDNPAEADIIVLLQSAEYKTVDYLRVLENDPTVREHAERVYVIDYDDHPEGLLAGLYTSIERSFFDAELHRVWPLLFMNNELVYGLQPEALFARKPRRLFSFVGAASHPVRERILAAFAQPSPSYHVQRVDKWYNHRDAERQQFVEVALDSWFCLCPRGLASYTNRICEVMAMGRVPVIIADDWLPFSFPETDRYFLRVPEKAIEDLPDILEVQKDRAAELGRNARTLWEKYCSMDQRIISALDCLSRLAQRSGPRPSFEDYRAKWHSPEFLRRCGWTLRQRVALRMKQRWQRTPLARAFSS